MIQSPQNESWLDLKSIKEVMRISNNKGAQAPLKHAETDQYIEQTSESSEALDGTLRQYLRFNTGSARQSTSYQRPPLMIHLGGSSESSNSVIDRVTINGYIPSAFQVDNSQSNHVDTPINSIAQHHLQSLSNLLQHSETHQQQQQLAVNQFKRRQSSVNSQSKVESEEKLTTPQGQSQQEKIKHQEFPQTQSHKRKQSQLIDLTNKFDRSSCMMSQDKSLQSNLKLQVLDEEQSTNHLKMPPLYLPSSNDKENHNPYQKHHSNAFSSISFLKESSNCQPTVVPSSARAPKNDSNFIPPLLQLDQELTKFNERVNRLKRQFNTCSNGQVSSATGPYEQSPEKAPQTFEELCSQSPDSELVSSHQSSDIRSYLSQVIDVLDENDEESFQDKIDVNPYRSITISDQVVPQEPAEKIFKRNPSSCTALDQNDQLHQLKKENLRLQRELEAERQLHSQQLDSQSNQLLSNFEAQMRSRDEEHAIILEGLRCQYEDQLREMRVQMNEQRIYFETSLIEAQNARQIMELQHQKAVDEMERKMAVSTRNKQTLGKGSAQSQSMREFVRYQMQDVVDQNCLIKPEIISNPSPFSNVQINSKPPIQLITMSKKKEQAMNFSFSDANRTSSAEKKEAELFQFQNSQRKSYPADVTNDLENLSERVSPVQNRVAPSNSQSHYHSLRDYLDPSQIQANQISFALMDPTCDFMSPDAFKEKKGSQTTTNRKTRFFQSLEQQNFAPGQQPNFIIQENLEDLGNEDSGFVSDDQDYQERIVNESSLEEQEDASEDEYRDTCDIKFNLLMHNDDRIISQRQLMMMTGKSESQIDEEECDDDPAQSKAIHSSCINFKRNNMLPNINSLENTRKRIGHYKQ